MFPQHLRHLLNVIHALRGDHLSDLSSFQLFVHHRAYRKLAWRVMIFRRRWGGLPFNILSEHLDPNLTLKNIELAYKSPDLHSFIQQYVTEVLPISSVPETRVGYTYQVDATNAPQWLHALTDLWQGLEDILLTEDFAVKQESPCPQQVNIIVTTLFLLESFMPVLVHLLSSEMSAKALGDAGEFHGPLPGYYSNGKF